MLQDDKAETQVAFLFSFPPPNISFPSTWFQCSLSTVFLVNELALASGRSSLSLLNVPIVKLLFL